MNEQYELVGVIGTENFSQYNVMWDGKQVQQYESNHRVVPLMFKDLEPGTQLFIKKVE